MSLPDRRFPYTQALLEAISVAAGDGRREIRRALTREELEWPRAWPSPVCM